jgi:hypothetical protein
MGGLDFAARYGGFLAIWSEGAIAWWRTGHPNGVIVGWWRLVGWRIFRRRQVYGRIMVMVRVMVVVMMVRLEGVGRWWGRWGIV